jgi:hypothetical protein
VERSVADVRGGNVHIADPPQEKLYQIICKKSAVLRGCRFFVSAENLCRQMLANFQIPLQKKNIAL